MTVVNINLKNVGSNTSPIDSVTFYSPVYRDGATNNELVSTAEENVPLVDGVAAVDLTPGPVRVHFKVKGIADTVAKDGIVPDSGPVSLNEVIKESFTYTPAVVSDSLKVLNDERDQMIADIVEAAEQSIEAAEQANSVDRVAALEAMAGLSPESPVDGQTANLLSQPDTLTRAALDSTRVDMAVSSSQSTATLGPELVTASGWTLGAGWSGDLATGFVHASGDSSILEWDASGLAPGSYVVSFGVGSPGIAAVQNLNVTLGDSDAPYIYGTGTRYAGMVSTTAGSLKFAPVTTSPWAGTITNVSVKQVAGVAPAELSFVDAEGNTTAGVRTGLAAKKNYFAGNVAGQNNTSGDGNTAVGIDSMGANTTGTWNTALGWEALKANTSGTRNVAVGMRTLTNNTTGYRNIAVGQSSMVLNTTGQGNIAIGADSMLQNESGDQNIAIGLVALGSNRSGKRNIAVGYAAMNAAQAENNVAIGDHALYASESAGNVAIGSQAARYTKAGGATAIGTSAGMNNVSGVDNTTVGMEAGRGRAYGTANFNRVVAIGKNAGRRLGTGDDENTIVGFDAMANADGGTKNTIFGYSTGKSALGHKINGNVLFGSQVGNLLVTGGDNNVMIGNLTGRTTTTGARNILIGDGVITATPTTSDEINIGNVFCGSTAAGALLARLMGNVEMPNLPTTNPGVAGRLWNDAGTLKVS